MTQATATNHREERDGAGHLTDRALALDAIADRGCDCGTDEQGTCLACVCERALAADDAQPGHLSQGVRVPGAPNQGETMMQTAINIGPIVPLPDYISGDGLIGEWDLVPGVQLWCDVGRLRGWYLMIFGTPVTVLADEARAILRGSMKRLPARFRRPS